MSSHLPRPLRSRSRRAARAAAIAAPASYTGLGWVHDGVRHRVSLWPEVQFERESSLDEWLAAEPVESALASTALGVGALAWRRYLEYVPAGERAFLEKFQFGRLTALLVITRCPALLEALTETPALTGFLAAHRSLRGGDESGWCEIGAIFEREGIFGVLQWLGLPASRQTMSILQHIADPDLPRRLLEPLRTALWEPETLWALSHAPVLTDEQLARACHALAA